MSNSARKIKQDELRRLMSEQKKKLMQNVKKIESPLARYDKDGNLNCILCQSIVRSEAVWSVHLNSKKHKENVARKVKKKDDKAESPPPPQEPTVLKRPAPLPLPVCTKKVKSILKNAPVAPKYSTPINYLEDVDSSDNKLSDVVMKESNQVSDDSSESADETEESIKCDVLPEGFFDDPKLDAKVRNVEYKDPIEEEWEQFQKEIREETSKAQQIIAEDQEEATTERQIDEIDEQMRNWTRVVSLERRKKEVISIPVIKKETIKEESSDEESSFDEFLDWRSKKSFV